MAIDAKFYMASGDWNTTEEETKFLKKIVSKLENLGYTLRAGTEKEIEVALLRAVSKREIHPLKKERGFFSKRIFEQTLKTCSHSLTGTKEEKWRMAHIVGMMVGRDNFDYKNTNTNSSFLVGCFQDFDEILLCAKKNGLLVFNVKTKHGKEKFKIFLKMIGENMRKRNSYALIGPGKSSDLTKSKIEKILKVLANKNLVVRTSNQKNIMKFLPEPKDQKSFFIHSEKDLLKEKTFDEIRRENNGYNLVFWADSGYALGVAEKFFKGFKKKSERTKRRLEINVYKVLGPVKAWGGPSKFILTWGEPDALTQHALSIAKKNGVPIFNVDAKGDISKMKELLGDLNENNK